MIPDYQTLMKPVLLCVEKGERKVSEVVETLADQFSLTEEERLELLPSGRQTTISNRVNWAKTYLAKAGLVKVTRRAHFVITPRGTEALSDPTVVINKSFLKQFEEFEEFRTRKRDKEQQVIGQDEKELDQNATEGTPDELLDQAHTKINEALESELLERVREVEPTFFELMILNLLTAMGYGGTREGSATPLGGSGDNGVDGVINQDALGVDQIYIQAKRYAEGNIVGPSPIRDFFGSLNLKKAQKGIFITTSTFSKLAKETAQGLGSRIVLIDGVALAKLMLKYDIGCRNERTLYIKKIDEGFFES